MINVEKVSELHPYVDIDKLEAVKDVQPMILIGSNNSGLTVPLKTLQYKIKGLQTCKTRLGWTVHGPVSEHSTSKNLSLNIHLYIEEKDELTKLVKETYKIETFGIVHEKEKLSEADTQALQIMHCTMYIEKYW